MSEPIPPTPPVPPINQPPVNPPGVQPQPQPLPPAPKKKKKKHWILRIFGLLLLLIILLIAFAPMLASLGFVKSIVVAQVNDNINGSVEIGDYSAGWFSGISASDVKVYDSNKTLILQLNKFSTNLSLLDAIQRKFDLGDTVVDVDLTKAVIDENGNLNYAKLAKEAAKPQAKASGEHHAAEPASSNPLPPVHGKLTVNLKGAVYQQGSEQPLVTVQPSTAVITIKDINQPIDNDITLKYTAANGPVGTIHIVGNALAVKNSQLDTKNPVADEKLELSDVDLKALTAVVRILAPDVKLESSGVASGGLALKANGTDSLAAKGEIKVAKFDVAGAPLVGNDHLHIDDISIPLDLSRTMKDGKPYVDVTHADIVLNGGKLGKITVAASAPQDALIDAGKLVPGVINHVLGKDSSNQTLSIDGQGTATITADLDLASFADQLKNTIQLQQGMTLKQGHLSHITTIAISKDSAKINTDTKIPDIQGTSDGKPVALSPIAITAGMNAVGGAQPDLHDLSLKFTSAFLNASGGGPTLSQEKITGAFDLAKLQAEAAQFVNIDEVVNKPKEPTTAPAGPLPHVQLAGTGSFDLSTDGDLIKDNGTAKASVKLALAGISASGIKTNPPIKLDTLAAGVSADVVKNGAELAGAKNVSVTAVTTSGNATVLDVAATADVNVTQRPQASPLVTAPRWELTKLSVPDLKNLQGQFGAFVPVLTTKGLTIDNGSITGTTAGSYDGAKVTLTKPFVLTVANATLSRTDPLSKAVATVLNNETIQVNVGGSFGLPSETSGLSADLSALSVTSSSGLFSVSKTPNADFVANVLPGGAAVKGNGGIVISADLKKLYDVGVSAGVVPPATQPTDPGQLKSGKLDGTLTLSHGDKPQTDISFDGKLTGVTVTTAQKPIDNETITIALRAASNDDMSGISANAAIGSRFASAKVLNAIAHVGPHVGPLDMLQHADIEATVPDLPAVYSLMQAISPPAATTFSDLVQGPQLADASGNIQRILLAALDQPADDSDAAHPGETPEETARRHKRIKAARADAAAKKQADDEAAKKQADADAAAAAANVPPPPLQLTGGSLTLKAAANRDAATKTTTLTVSDMRVSNLAMQRSDTSKYAFARDVTFKLAASVQSTGDSTQTVMAQLKQLQVTQLAGDLVVAKLSMPKPIALANLSDSANTEAHGSIRLDGEIGDAAPLLQVLTGSPNKLPYTGAYATEQVLSTGSVTQGKLLRLNGAVGISNFQLYDASGKVVYTEPAVAVKDDADVILGKADSTGKSPDQLIVRTFSINMPKSQALSLNFSGRIIDPTKRRLIKGAGGAEVAKLDVTYDLEKLWPIIYPMLSPDVQAKYKDLKISGKESESFTVSGGFPVEKSFAKSMSQLNADGGLALEELDLPQGVNISKFNLLFTMKNGVLMTLAGQGQQVNTGTATPGGTATTVVAKTAVANQGAVDFSGMQIDMSKPGMPLTIEKNHKLLQSIHLNPVLANTLGAGNGLFKDAAAASGLVDVTIVECTNVPIGDIVASRSNHQSTVLYTVSDLAINGPGPMLLSIPMGLGGQGLHGGIKNGKLSIVNGEVTNDFSLDIVRYKKPNTGTASASDASSTYPNAVDDQGNQLVPVTMPLHFAGGVTLATGALKNFGVTLPASLLDPMLKSWGMKSLVGAFPQGALVPFKGTTSAPAFDVEKFAKDNAGKAALNQAGKLLGGGNSNNAANGNNGNSQDPLQNLGNLLKKKKKTSDGSDGN